MKWIPLKIYQGDLLLKEVEYVCKIYNSIVQQFKNNKTEENRDKYVNIRDEIKKRIFEINNFYSNNINDNRIGIFEQGKNILEEILKNQVQINNCIKPHKKKNLIKTNENLLKNEIDMINHINENKINMNSISKGKIGYFSPEYVVIGFCDQKEAFNYYKNMNIKVNRTKVVNSYKDPYIYHFILKSKPWRGIPSYHNKICVDPMTRFYEMARKTSFYYDILKIFSIKFPKTI